MKVLAETVVRSAENVLTVNVTVVRIDRKCSHRNLVLSTALLLLAVSFLSIVIVQLARIIVNYRACP